MPDVPLRQRIVVPREHPAFAGHFPGQPLLPGVVLLGEALEVLLRATPDTLAGAPRLSAVKFLAPVLPGAELEVRWMPPATGRMRFEVWRHASDDPDDGVLAASGQLETGGSAA